jgi:hypothetical protein
MNWRRDVYAAFLRDVEAAAVQGGTAASHRGLDQSLRALQIAGPEALARRAEHLVSVLGTPEAEQARGDFIAAARLTLTRAA